MMDLGMILARLRPTCHVIMTDYGSNYGLTWLETGGIKPGNKDTQNYPNAVMVGRQISHLMKNIGGVDFLRYQVAPATTCYGHSLSAQICGHLGYYLKFRFGAT